LEKTLSVTNFAIFSATLSSSLKLRTKDESVSLTIATTAHNKLLHNVSKHGKGIAAKDRGGSEEDSFETEYCFPVC
jgi:hypothetical protein